MAHQFTTQTSSEKNWTGSGSKYAIQIGVITTKGRFILLPNGSLGFDETHMNPAPKNFFERIQNKIIEHILNRDEFKKLGPQESWILGTLEAVKLSVRIKNMLEKEEDDDQICLL